jgi:hypothetical protein
VLHLAEEKRNLTRPVAFRVRASASCSCSSSSLPLSARSPIQFTMHAWPALRAFRFKAATLMPVAARSMPRFNLNTRRAQQLAPLVVVALCLREGKRRGAAAPALLGRWGDVTLTAVGQLATPALPRNSMAGGTIAWDAHGTFWLMEQRKPCTNRAVSWPGRVVVPAARSNSGRGLCCHGTLCLNEQSYRRRPYVRRAASTYDCKRQFPIRRGPSPTET